MTNPPELSRRERQIMDIVYRRGEATAAEVLAEMAEPPSYSAVRAHLRVLEAKGHLDHREDGPRYVFRPTRPRDEVSESALKRVVRTFFGGSVEATVAALLELEDGQLGAEELERLAERVAEARRKGQ
jgi:BlaI family transcriptional regulator, penicillinase repressor